MEWFNPSSGGITEGTPVKGGLRYSFTAPFKGDAVLYSSKKDIALTKRCDGNVANEFSLNRA